MCDLIRLCLGKKYCPWCYVPKFTGAKDYTWREVFWANILYRRPWMGFWMRYDNLIGRIGLPLHNRWHQCN